MDRGRSISGTIMARYEPETSHHLVVHDILPLLPDGVYAPGSDACARAFQAASSSHARTKRNGQPAAIAH